mgnify:CR=1 FL=1
MPGRGDEGGAGQRNEDSDHGARGAAPPAAERFADSCVHHLAESHAGWLALNSTDPVADFGAFVHEIPREELQAQVWSQFYRKRVADEQIANRLRLLGCGYAQGYLYRAPARLTH